MQPDRPRCFFQFFLLSSSKWRLVVAPFHSFPLCYVWPRGELTHAGNLASFWPLLSLNVSVTGGLEVHPFFCTGVLDRGRAGATLFLSPATRFPRTSSGNTDGCISPLARIPQCLLMALVKIVYCMELSCSAGQIRFKTERSLLLIHPFLDSSISGL